MNRISTMVVDDEPLAAQLLGDYVRQTPFLSLEGICSSAVEAFSMWQEHPADLLFLDIQMPQMNGLELSRTLGERSRVIFTTAFEQADQLRRVPPGGRQGPPLVRGRNDRYRSGLARGDSGRP